MNKEEYSKFKLDFIAQTLAKEELFNQWLRRFFYLNDSLAKEYDSIYQNSFYVMFYELVTVGLQFSEELLENIKDGNNTEKKELYSVLIKGLKNFKSQFTENEFDFIEYKRHSSAHIFQTHYDKRISKNGKFILERKGISIDDLNSEFSAILIKYGFDRGFDEFMTTKLYPKVNDLYAEYGRIKTHYNKDVYKK